MATRIAPDKGRPWVAIEIPIEKPLPDYDLEDIEQPTPRDIDGLLVSQGFRDLVDDSRGVLTELIANPPALHSLGGPPHMDLAPSLHFEIAQLTGAICPGGNAVYRPGLWIVIHDTKAEQKHEMSDDALAHVRVIVEEFVKRLGL
jgi:hypothetical protein